LAVGLARNTGISGEAESVASMVSGVIRSSEDSVALFGNKADAISRLWELRADCGEPDWDGAGAEPVDEQAVRNAEELIRALPDAFPMPEIAAEPDGCVSLDWILSRNRMFTMSVSARPTLAYAWLDGSDRGHGVADSDGLSVPPRVLDAIRAILGCEYAAIRAA